MREIKFRVWITDWGNSISRLEYIKEGFNHVYFGNWERGGYRNAIFQQYTGLKDKNGREIYEGDIIQLENAPYKYEVVWNKWHWGIDSKGIVADFIQGFTIAVEERCIVIGNIFENPDLLK